MSTVSAGGDSISHLLASEILQERDSPGTSLVIAPVTDGP